MSALALLATSSIPTPKINYWAIMPIIIMLGGAVALLAVSAMVRRPLKVTVATVGTVVICATALGFAIAQWSMVTQHGSYTTVDQAIVADGFASVVLMLVPCAMILTALIGDGYLRREGIEGPEFHVLALVSASGAMVMGVANDLIVIFLGLEILSIALYVLTAYNHKRAASGEAALKYFILGGFSSAVFVYGIALVYGATGSTNLTQIADFLSRNVVASNGLLLAGLALLLVGFGFKVAAVPFHMWTPDVYQGAPSPVTGFMAAVAKVGAFAALLRVFVSSFGVLHTDWRPLVWGLAALSLLVGAGLALVQRDVKRMLAYSSINQAGFILLGVEAATTRGISASLYYVFTYTFMVIGSFGIVTLMGRDADRAHDLSTYRGLARRQPLIALALAVLLLAQAGAPFTTGLWAKLQVVLATVTAGSVVLAAIAMFSAAVAAFFYLRVAVLMYAGGAGAPAEGADLVDADAPPVTQEGASGNGAAPSDGHGMAVPLWTGTERSTAVVTGLNTELVLGDVAPAPQEESKVPVPALSALAIALCVGVTVVFGILPTPLISMAHHASLLFP